MSLLDVTPTMPTPATTPTIAAPIAPLASTAALEPQERQLLQWLAEGHSSKAIARLLGGSDKTVRTYLSHLYAKIGVSNGKAAVAWLLTHPVLAASARPPHFPGAAACSQAAALTTVAEGLDSATVFLSPPPAATPSAQPLCAWYLQCLAKGHWSAAIDHWQMCAEAQRPSAARYTLALMLLLQTRFDEAMQEARLQDAPALHALQLAEQWLFYRDVEKRDQLQLLVEKMPAGHPDKYPTLLALYQGAMSLGEVQAALQAVQALFSEAVAALYPAPATAIAA